MLLSQRARAPAVFALLGLSLSPAFANVLQVAPSGAGYAQIQAAVMAATDGDVILIKSGVYGAVTIDGKGLTLVNQSMSNVSILGTTTVKNLSASQRVILSGLRGQGQPSAQYSATDGIGLLIENNAGNVRVENCAFFGAIGWWDNTHGPSPIVGCYLNTPECKGRHGAVLNQNTAGVSFSACEIRGGRGADGAHTTIFECGVGQSERGGDGLVVSATLASLYDSTCTGGRGGSNGTVGGAGGAGCRATAGTSQTGVFASGSVFGGGNGGDAWDLFNSGAGAGGTGLFVSLSTGAHLLAHQAYGGSGGLADSGGQPPGPHGTPMGGGGPIFLDPETRIAMTTDRIVRAGSVVDLRIQGTPGQRIELLVSRAPTFQILPSWRGTLLSLPGKGSIQIPLGTIPQPGILFTRYIAPPLPPGVQVLTVFVQPFRDDPILGPKLGTGTTLTLVP